MVSTVVHHRGVVPSGKQVSSLTMHVTDWWLRSVHNPWCKLTRFEGSVHLSESRPSIAAGRSIVQQAPLCCFRH